MLLNQYIAFCYSEQFIANFIPCFLQFSFGLPSPAKFLPKTRRDSRRDLGEILKSRRDSRRDLGEILKSRRPKTRRDIKISSRFLPRSRRDLKISAAKNSPRISTRFQVRS